MTGRVVNLRTARKARARAEKRREAKANAAKFGRTKATRALEEAERQKADRDHDMHRRDP